MKHMIWRVLLLSFGLVLSAAAFGQGPKSYRDGHGGEVFFPVGDISFADEVVSFTSGEPKARAEKDRIPEETLGIPDYDRDEDDNFLTLGCGGVVVVRFTDNSLIDIDGPDLYVFEIGPAVEPTDLAISRDGESWVEIGRIAGGRADVDIAQFVDGCEPYSHVRLTDGRTDCGGKYPGADIDAVGAIGSGIKVQLDSSVLFASGKAVPRPEAEAELGKVADLIRAHDGARVVIEGHTDHVGSDGVNQALSEQRAAAVELYLAAAGGMESITFISRGYGEKRPVASNETSEGRQLNRRVEITVIPQSPAVARNGSAVQCAEVTQTDEAEEALTGTWTGTGQQFDSNISWSIEIAFEDDGVDIRYPSLACGGQLQPVSGSEARFVYRERIRFGLSQCVNNGRVVLERTSEDTLSYEWYYESGILGACRI